MCAAGRPILSAEVAPPIDLAHATLPKSRDAKVVSKATGLSVLTERPEAITGTDITIIKLLMVGKTPGAEEARRSNLAGTALYVPLSAEVAQPVR